jgi:hypothetical protein
MRGRQRESSQTRNSYDLQKSSLAPLRKLAAVNNINACFRVHVTPILEHELYWSTLHVAYTQPTYRSRPSAEAAFTTVRELLRESRAISNDAARCMLESSQSNVSPE